MFGITISGDKLIEKKLNAMETKIAKKLVRTSLRKAAKPVLKSAKENCPVDSGALKKSLKVRSGKKQKKGEYFIQILTSDKDNWYKGEQFYGAFIEFGTNKMPARPFMRPAYDTQKATARKILISELRQGIYQAAK